MKNPTIKEHYRIIFALVNWGFTMEDIKNMTMEEIAIFKELLEEEVRNARRRSGY